MCTTHLHHSWSRAKCLLTTGFFALGCCRIFTFCTNHILKTCDQPHPRFDPCITLQRKGSVLEPVGSRAKYPLAMTPTWCCLLKKQWSWLKKELLTLRPAQEDETQVAGQGAWHADPMFLSCKQTSPQGNPWWSPAEATVRGRVNSKGQHPCPLKMFVLDRLLDKKRDTQTDLVKPWDSIKFISVLLYLMYLFAGLASFQYLFFGLKQKFYL